MDFDTLRVLATRRADLIIFFPDHLDALRNWKYVYKDNPNSNLDRVLGPNAEWRAVFDQKPKQYWAEALRDLYVEQIRTLGYGYFDYERISMKADRHLYLLMFFSRDKNGVDIWRRVSERKADNQRTFDFPSPD